MQLLLCIKTCYGNWGETLAEKGATYELLDRAKCPKLPCSQGVVSLVGVYHSYTSPCIPGSNWLPEDHFIPLNDPKAKFDRETHSEPKVTEPFIDQTVRLS